MLTKRRKKIKKKGFNFKKFFGILVFACLFIFLLYSSINMLIKRIELQKELDNLEAEQEKLLKERESLKFSLGEVYSEAYLEKIAREDLNLKKPGEKVFVIKKEGEVIKENNEEEMVEETFINKIQSFFKSFNK
ncbi:MAG TPA: septum formation initiator family protein [Candidatus Pacearchaeota archaeon]|nr:septum formation initiator family protein [Candidatus Pacearchaeota archaeon]